MYKQVNRLITNGLLSFCFSNSATISWILWRKVWRSESVCCGKVRWERTEENDDFLADVFSVQQIAVTRGAQNMFMLFHSGTKSKDSASICLSVSSCYRQNSCQGTRPKRLSGMTRPPVCSQHGIGRRIWFVIIRTSVKSELSSDNDLSIYFLVFKTKTLRCTLIIYARDREKAPRPETLKTMVTTW